MKNDEEIWCMTTEMTPNTSLNIAPCLRARDYKDPPCVLAMIPNCYGIDRAAFNQGVNALFNLSIDYELSAPLVAMGPNAVAVYADTE